MTKGESWGADDKQDQAQTEEEEEEEECRAGHCGANMKKDKKQSRLMALTWWLLKPVKLYGCLVCLHLTLEFEGLSRYQITLVWIKHSYMLPQQS